MKILTFFLFILVGGLTLATIPLAKSPQSKFQAMAPQNVQSGQVEYSLEAESFGEPNWSYGGQRIFVYGANPQDIKVLLNFLVQHKFGRVHEYWPELNDTRKDAAFLIYPQWKACSQCHGGMNIYDTELWRLKWTLEKYIDFKVNNGDFPKINYRTNES